MRSCRFHVLIADTSVVPALTRERPTAQCDLSGVFSGRADCVGVLQTVRCGRKTDSRMFVR